MKASAALYIRRKRWRLRTKKRDWWRRSARLHSLGFKPERVVREDHFGIFAERHRISELAVYIVHASLLLIFLGTVVDGIWGWRGTLNLNEGQTSNRVELRDGNTRTLPFAIRCDSAGQENYKDGTPKKWWSKLAVVEDGRDVRTKEIVVNDPLLYSGVRFYQSSYGANGKVNKLMLTAAPSHFSDHFPNPGSGEKKEIGLALNETIALDADTTLRFAEFFPDYAVRDGQVYRKSNDFENPAVHLVVTSKVCRDKGRGEGLRRLVPADGRGRRQLEGALPTPGHQPEDATLHGIAGFARTGTVGSVVWRRAHGRGTVIRVLRGAHAVLGGTGSGSEDGQDPAVDRGKREPQPGRI